MLEAVQFLCPAIYTFVYSAYAAPSVLKWGDRSIPSAEGVQQGDPLGPPTTLLPDTTSALFEFKVRVQRALFG